jgi:hypothetical protein
MAGPRRELLAVPAAVIVVVVLLIAAWSGVEAINARRQESSDELERFLDCVESEVTQRTAPGDTVRVETAGDTFLLQRVSEMVYPRLRLSTDPDATALVVRNPDPGDGVVCEFVVITVGSEEPP